MTCSQSGNLLPNGKVHIDQSNNLLTDTPKIELNHFKDLSINDIYDCFKINNRILMNDYMITQMKTYQCGLLPIMKIR